MMVVDTSAIVAVMTSEPDASDFLAELGRASRTKVSAVSVLEATQVLARWGDVAATAGLDGLLERFGIEIETVDPDQLARARAAFLKYGKGRGHPAQLNICDCFAYALAKSLDAPLLFKGGDFSHTDVRRAGP